MKTVIMLRPLQAPNFTVNTGEEYTCSAEEAERLIANGRAKAKPRKTRKTRKTNTPEYVAEPGEERY